ncbi:hypothetical protein [Planktothrix agardhii]|jgi:hypothetical protein|uniref:hypothetical protein n=1 Tax=Planktothrix agardhii TaxID=1160 RepID=UPI001F2DEA03|nr:hypothetical protein [Planktothrix agardhii]MCF3578131.1 hypothetical protein [Planktothrix agardhii 1812]MCF3583288.1 hypothetical protein [Planktothrix agardhii 1811]
MAVRLTEKQFDHLQSLVTKLQALTDEDTEEGQTVDDIAELLQNVEIDKTYNDLVIETVMKTKHGTYIV